MCDRDARALRLKARFQIIELIDRRREAEGDMGIGASIERRILDSELADLEEALAAAPAVRRQ